MNFAAGLIASSQSTLLASCERPAWLADTIRRLPMRYGLLIGRCYDWAAEAVRNAPEFTTSLRLIEERLCWAALARFVLAKATIESEKIGRLSIGVYPPVEVVVANAIRYNLSAGQLNNLAALLLVEQQDLDEVRAKFTQEIARRAAVPAPRSQDAES